MKKIPTNENSNEQNLMYKFVSKTKELLEIEKHKKFLFFRLRKFLPGI